ncbi:restriction endonuclease subunit S [Streptococcus mitis]|uniref:restriction endonuclease subunit S n=1 Tax=Streptococcus mitis TaxID=28037 RepID=UPI002284F09C|nr:restriction endonuclease subunit S [Streptococcus mitis]MCY7153049.1 restriction endonuclease subunit S [Streptococcus mitis]
MNILEEIQNCPVEWKELGEICELKNGYTPSKTNKEFWKNGTIPWFRLEDIRKNGRVLSNSLQHVSRNAIKGGKVFTANSLIISTTATIGEVALITVPFLCNQQITAVMKKQKYEKDLDIKFLFYYLQILSSDMKKGINEGNFPIVSISKMRNFKIPIPSLEIQEKIVQKLDKMTEYVIELTSKLTSELTSRKKQYSFYRDKLLSFDDEVYQVEWKVLKDVATLKNGKDWKALSSGEIPVYGSGGEMGEFVSDYSYDKPTVLIPRKGSISNLFYLEKAFWNVDTIYYTEIDENLVIPKYFYYYLTTVELEEMATNPTRPSLTQAILDKIRIPVPSLEIQSRIVQVLDNFDTVCNNLNVGLPKEIELRQKQYEYFREKLLTFVAEGEYTESRVEEWDNSAIIKLLQWVFGPIRVKVGQVVNLQRGKRLVRKQLTTSGSVPVYQNSLATLGYYTESNRVKNTSFVICAGAAGEIGYSAVDFWAADDVYTLETSDNISDKFMYYVLLSKQDRLKSQVRKASIPRLSKDAIDKVTFYLPPLSEQKRIVSILDNFNTLTNSLSEGLPKEIELRQKHYEYWREQLLYFNE